MPSKKDATPDKDKVIEDLYKLLPKKAADFCSMQVRVCNTNKYGIRWRPREKSICLSLKHISPKCYRALRSQLILPSERTLDNAVKNLIISEGISQSILDMMKLKIPGMSKEERIVVLSFDEMAIKKFLRYNPTTDKIEGYETVKKSYTANKKPNQRKRNRVCTKLKKPSLATAKKPKVADHALVFMIRGLKDFRKQHFSFYYSAGEKKNKKKTGLCMFLKRADAKGQGAKVFQE